MNYMDIPESVVSNAEFAPLETAYRNYEANPTVANAAAFIDEAGKVQRIASGNGYNVDSPNVKVNAAMEADAAGLGAQSEIGVEATDIGATAKDIGAGAMDIGKNAADIGATAKAYVDSENGVGDNGSGKVTGIIDGIKIIDGKVGGKIPLDEFKSIRKLSIKNPDADSMTLGRYTHGKDSYIQRAGTNSSYFDLGNDWKALKTNYNLTDQELFELFNVVALEEALIKGKTLRFSHNPLDDSNRKTFLFQEWKYIKKRLFLNDKNLFYDGGFWYVG